MKILYDNIIPTAVKHVWGQSLNCVLKKEFIIIFFFSILVYGGALANAPSLLLALLHNIFKNSSKLRL